MTMGGFHYRIDVLFLQGENGGEEKKAGSHTGLPLPGATARADPSTGPSALLRTGSGQAAPLEGTAQEEVGDGALLAGVASALGSERLEMLG